MEKKRPRLRPAAFDGWGNYMKSKKKKLETQFNGHISQEKNWNGSKCASLFQGVAIFVNGYTKPSANELKRLMQLHGGTYCHYFSQSSTTHIIATNLANSKVHGLKGKKIVHPDWITDSIKQGKLLPYTSYLLYKPDLLRGQKQLHDESSFKLAGSDKSKCQTSKTINLPSTHAFKGQESSFISDETTIHNNNNCSTGSCLNEVIKFSDFTLKNVSEVHSSAEDIFVNHNYKPLKETPSCIQPDHSSKEHGVKETKSLSEFYNKSRLHHISTIGAEFKDYIIKLRQENSGEFKGKEKLQQWKKAQISTLECRTPQKDKYINQETKLCNSSLQFNNCQRVVNEDITKQKIIMHVDMDCFFVSVGLKKHPEMIGKPVAVAHSRGRNVQPTLGSDPEFELRYYHQKIKDKALKNYKSNEIHKNIITDAISSHLDNEMHATSPAVWGSTSEIACCSYEARKAGVCNGMFLGNALKLCPDLQIIPYEFEEYKNVSKVLYDIVSSYTLCIEAVSCDEMFVDCTELLKETNTTPLEFATFLRQEINKKTGCTASAGFAHNKLLARLATKVAKPNGQFHLEPSEVEEFMKLQKIKDLPGVGSITTAKLEGMGVHLCEQLQSIPLGKLKQTFGPKIGHLLYNHCRGYDGRNIVTEKERKSVSAEINYGIRFQQERDAYDFLSELAAEVHCRLSKVNMKGRSLTLKLKVRNKDAPSESYKFMGHGVCDNVSKSTILPFATDDKKVICMECINLLKSLKIIPHDLRGMGIQIGKLESTFSKKQQGKNLEDFIKRNTVNTDKNGNSRPIKSFLYKQSTYKKTFQDNCQDKEWDVIRGHTSVESVTCNCNSSVTSVLAKECLIPDKPKAIASIETKEIKSKTELTVKPHYLKHHLIPQPCSSNKYTINSFYTADKSTVPHLCGAVSVEDVKTLLTEWIETTKVPSEEDTSVFTNYISDVVKEQNLEKLDLIIKCFHRLSKKGGISWQEVFLSVISTMQLEVLQLYNNYLKVNVDF